jgi:hypothetical protein
VKIVAMERNVMAVALGILGMFLWGNVFHLPILLMESVDQPTEQFLAHHHQQQLIFVVLAQLPQLPVLVLGFGLAPDRMAKTASAARLLKAVAVLLAQLLFLPDR